MTIADLSQAAITIYGLHVKTRTIRTSMELMAKASRRNGNLLVSTAVVCRDHVKYDKQFCPSIRIRSSIPHQLSPEDEEILDKLEISVKEARANIQRQSKGQDEATYARKIHPIASVVVNPLHLTRKKSSLWEALEALFTMECVVVTAYLEAVVPVLYSGYMLLMVHFPSAPYHAELTGITRESVGATVLSVFVFGLLQVSSFAVLAVVIKRNCGMRMIDHLAFVLETQMFLIQCKLMVWSMLTLCFRVTHFGKILV
ncbi:hypothetical protein PHYSODRAFT_303330 [Phytophthora sojae]|uniref:Uncharacterized protein n=1 Tax=Phytophthora sojae (strain P6497) TaxID=1094619 RepID=G4ZRX4_PHYSP|nr:hypothetical protein PHYSODRAFT_303330 [Phytophthora sojae]EGZ14011.1 hypothetical protein PHYSODRAFT_303330 [Phytophthora sojae]|eukprot:XP_009531440.1 hypothetical protein PHYSODRAFT_303330 [Phytophthora sojae]